MVRGRAKRKSKRKPRTKINFKDSEKKPSRKRPRAKRKSKARKPKKQAGFFALRGALRKKLMERGMKKNRKRKTSFIKSLKTSLRVRKKPEIVKKLRYKFSVREPKKLVVIPKFRDIRKVDFRYPLLEPFAYARIKWMDEDGKIVYNVEEPELSQKERHIFKRIEKYLTEMIDVELSKLGTKEEMIKYLQRNMETALNVLKIRINKESYEKLMYYIFRNFVGLNEIEALMHDPYIEDIGCVGTDVNVYVVHRTFGSIETNIKFKDPKYLENFVIKIAEKCGRYISYAQPLFDGSLPDGSRVQATLAKDVTTKGSSFSIRKFRKNPFSPVDMLNLKTCSPEMMAYLWILVENGANILVCGGVSTGKTTMLNTLSMFIQPEKKIVSIEETREINLPHENWIPAVTRPGFGIPDAGIRYGEVDLFQLLKESFRQNPNYIIVGEVRGREAFVLFQSMASGNPALGTMHAGSVDDVIKRLETRPIELSPSLIESLDAVIVMVNAKERGASARRVGEIEEIKSINADTGRAKTIKIFSWMPAKDMFESNVKGSDVLRKIAFEKGIGFRRLLKEIEDRKGVLEWMRKYEIVQFDEVSALINLYYRDKKTIMTWVEKDLEPYKTKTKKEVMEMFKGGKQ